MLKKAVRYWLPPFLWMAIIFWASSFQTLRASPVNWQDFIIRKTAHFLEYVVLFILLFRGFKNTTNLPLSRISLFSFLLSVFYAATDEFHQTLVNGRTGMIRDVFIDTIGALGGWLAARKFDKKSNDKL